MFGSVTPSNPWRVQLAIGCLVATLAGSAVAAGAAPSDQEDGQWTMPAKNYARHTL